MILTINTGSSSLKAALYQGDGSERAELAVRVERIGHASARMDITDRLGQILFNEQAPLPDHHAALVMLINWLQARPEYPLDAIGHRIVHGGKHYTLPQRVTPALIEALHHLIPIDPQHLPQAIDAMTTATAAYPLVPQIACFDTWFHRTMPTVARMYALPRRLWEAGVMRYGFHGLSCEYIMHEFARLDSGANAGRVIIAHLGNGASMTAVRDGASIDTTMGFTPTGGLMMGTRSGDLDPGVLLHLLESEHIAAADLSRLVNGEAGLRGVSGRSADMQELLAAEATDPHAAEAIALFCYEARKFLGALMAVLGGVDTIIFTGGIGEHGSQIRERICTPLQDLGIRLDPRHNAAHAPVISTEGSPVTVRVMPTDEDRMIARHTYRLFQEERT